MRVLSWNIHHGADAWDHLDLEAVAERIASADADVVLLQEVDCCWGPRSDDVNQTQWLAERLEMHGTYGWTRSQPRRHGPAEGTSGNALLSRGARDAELSLRRRRTTCRSSSTWRCPSRPRASPR